MERINFSYRVFDNCLEIIPDDGIKDNSLYVLTIKDLRSEDQTKVLDKKKFEITTEMKPSYCSIDAIKALVYDFDIPESTILYQIRQASKEADFINGGPVQLDQDGNPPFPVEKFVEVKASLLSLTRAYVTGAAHIGLQGTLGQVSFKNGDSLGNINKLISALRDEAEKWQDAIRGYVFPGRNEPAYALRGNYTLRATPASVILRNFSRDVNQGLRERTVI